MRDEYEPSMSLRSSGLRLLELNGISRTIFFRTDVQRPGISLRASGL